MSVEDDAPAQADAYAGLLANFGSEIGSTLEDLKSDWNDTDYDFKENVENMPTRTYSLPANTSRRCYRGSMDETDGLSDWSLVKARPLAFANPVYDLMMLGQVVSKSHHMNLIPLAQFNINKPHDGDGRKHGKHKQHKKGTLMNKLSHFSIRKHHSMRKTEHEMTVTAPLWTDVPTVEEPVKRSASLSRPSVTVEPARESEYTKEKPTRPSALALQKEEEEVIVKAPPQKTPRTSKGNFSLLCESPGDPYPQNTQEPPSLDLPTDRNTLQCSVSTSSIPSDLSEELGEEERTTKTMMEVMHEIEDDSADQEEVTQQKEETTAQELPAADTETIAEEGPLLKRNKTLKWSGSRAAPALIREFTKKSKKAASGQTKQLESVATDSPEVSAGESPAKSLIGDSAEPVVVETETDSVKNLQMDRLQVESGKSSSTPSTPKKRDSSAFTILSSLLPPAPKLRRSESSKIRMYIHRMGTNPQNALGYATIEFVKQTIQSKEHRPVVILHSIRSFLTDMKKYLIANPHVGFMGKLQKVIKNMPINDVEGAIDDALERLVLYPLRDLIYKRLVIDYARTGKIELVEDAIKLGQTKSLQELGIRTSLIPPNEEAMETVKHYFMELQSTYSPYYKLKHLLSAVTTIYENTSDLTCEDQSARMIGADDFFPLLVHAIVKCDFTAADIEAQYIDGLLDPGLLLGEGGYYLTSLISAVQLLSSMKQSERPLPNITDLQGFLKVGISSKTEKLMDSDGILMHKTLHVPPSMTAHNLGMMIAKKYGMKNAKDFCLHVVVNGVAYPLKPQEFPQLVKMDLLTQFSNESFYFIYRQLEKSQEKPSERPSTIDSEQLKVNTEDGETVHTAEKDIVQSQSTSTSSEAASSDSDTAAKPEKKEKPVTLDEILPPSGFALEDVSSSPGFADIPLPTDLLLHEAATASGGEDAMQSPSDAMPPPPPDDATEIETRCRGDNTGILPGALPEESTLDDTLPPPDDDTLPPPDDTFPPPDDTITPPEESLPPPDAPPPPDETLLPPDDTLPPPDATLPPPDATPPPDETLSPPDDTVPPPDETLPPPDDTLPPPDATPPPDETLSPPDDSLPPPDATPPDDGLPPADDALPPPDDTFPPPDDTLPPPDDTIPPPDATLPPPDDTLPPPDDTIPPPDDTLPPPDDTIPLPDDTLPPPFANLPPDATSSPIHAMLPPPDDTDYTLDATLTPDDNPLPLDLEILPPPSSEDPRIPVIDVERSNGGFDTSDPESGDDTLIDESYLRATVVDDMLSPVKKRSAPPAKEAVLMEEEEEEEEDEEFVLPAEDSSPSVVRGEVPPQVTRTDLSHSDQELRPGSVLSDVSTGCHSDGYYGAGSDGRHSSRGYHSDGHQVDDGSLEKNVHSSVSELKTYFEGEISKVYQKSGRTGSPHSTK